MYLLQHSFSYIENILTFVFHRERQKRVVFWKMCFRPYYLHSANNMANWNVNPNIRQLNTRRFKTLLRFILRL